LLGGKRTSADTAWGHWEKKKKKKKKKKRKRVWTKKKG